MYVYINHLCFHFCFLEPSPILLLLVNVKFRPLRQEGAESATFTTDYTA